MELRPPVPDVQEQSMLDDLERYREQERRAIIEEAHANAARVVREAYREARSNLRSAIEEERKRMANRLHKTEAEIQTRRRLVLQEKSRHALERGWSLLPELLRQRWSETASRRSWCDALLKEAFERLQPGAWRIEHPIDWPAREQDQVRENVSEHCGVEPTFVRTESFDVGLRVASTGAYLDGTIDGLLADRKHIEGLLLTAFAAAEDTV